jgi:hypothetical protein
MTLSLAIQSTNSFFYDKRASYYLQSADILSGDRCFLSTIPAIPRQLFSVPYDMP